MNKLLDDIFKNWDKYYESDPYRIINALLLERCTLLQGGGVEYREGIGNKVELPIDKVELPEAMSASRLKKYVGV